MFRNNVSKVYSKLAEHNSCFKDMIVVACSRGYLKGLLNSIKMKDYCSVIRYAYLFQICVNYKANKVVIKSIKLDDNNCLLVELNNNMVLRC